jgi:uncharacterized protein YcaQ
MGRGVPRIDRETVVRLWLHRQGLAVPRGTARLTRAAFRDHLERTGGLQLDSINVLERAHYLTLWSRFGPYRRSTVDRWCWRDRVAYEYWGHEASLLPISHLPVGRRRMRRFPPASWRNQAWWKVFNVPAAVKRRVLRRLRDEGPLESADFETRPEDEAAREKHGGTMPLAKADKRALQLLWHEGQAAVATRRHFRRVYDLAERVYPEGPAASLAEYHDSWLFAGLSGNGIASAEHLDNYVTGPRLTAPERRKVLARALRAKRIVEVAVDGLRGPFYALPEHLQGAGDLAPPRGTHLLCPFDSLLWQRRRAEQLLGFQYRIEIYTPPARRRFGYYVMPILHDGCLVGRLDPKLHRDREELEIKSIHLERGFRRDAGFDRALGQALGDLATFTGATRITLPDRYGTPELRRCGSARAGRR